VHRSIMAPPRKMGGGAAARYGGRGGGEVIELVSTSSDDILAVVERDKQAPPARKPLFVNAQKMKDKLQANMGKPRYCVTNFYHADGFCQKVARNHIFEVATLAVISFNALWIAIDVDCNTAEVLHLAHPVFIIAENFFCFYFTVEISFRFGAFKTKRNCMKDAWFVFDSFMVSMMIFETWVLTAVLLLAMGGSGGSGIGNAGMLRLLRLLRLSRMARLARLLRSMPELLILIKGMIASVRSVFFTMLLIFLILYVFSILFRQLTDGSDLGATYFPSMTTTANNLVVRGVFFQDAGDMQLDFVKDNQQHLLFCYYLFVLLATLTVLNMLIGVLCEVIFATADFEHETLTIHFVSDHLRIIVEEVMEKTGNMPEQDEEFSIDKEDFLNILQHRDASGLLNEVRVDVFGMVDLVDTIFATETGGERVLTFGDLIKVMLDQRTTADQTVKDVTDMRKYFQGRVEGREKDYNASLFALGATVEKACGLPEGEYAREVKQALKELKQVRAASDQSAGSPHQEKEKVRAASHQSAGSWKQRRSVVDVGEGPVTSDFEEVADEIGVPFKIVSGASLVPEYGVRTQKSCGVDASIDRKGLENLDFPVSQSLRDSADAVQAELLPMSLSSHRSLEESPEDITHARGCSVALNHPNFIEEM